MTLSRATVQNRAAAVRTALSKADTNRDGKPDLVAEFEVSDARVGTALEPD